jgi:predicted phosphodiesterase
LFHRYSEETINACIDILRSSPTYPQALARIVSEVDSRLERTALGKLFKRAGCEAPSKYVGENLVPPEPRASGFSSFLGGSVLVVPKAGVAQKEQREQSRKLETIVAIPDIHAPFHDRLAVSTCVEAVRQLKPDHLVLLGDVVDSYDISQFPRDPGRKHRYKDELDSANTVLDEFGSLGVDDVRFCAGNHEWRLDKYIATKAPELHGLITIEDQLHIKDRGWEWCPYGEVTTIGRFRFSHEFGSCGKYAAAQALAGVRHCIVFGHTHRAQCEYGGLADGERHVAWSAGWLGDYESLAFSYKKKWQARREWTHGFVWIVLDETGCGWAQFVPVLDGRCIVDGHVISGRKEAA